MMDFSKGLSVDQLISSLRALAHFHALGYAYRQIKKIEFEDKFNFMSVFFKNFETDKELQDFMDMNMGLVLDDMKGSPVEHLIPKVEKLRAGIPQK
jgi:hypothetical protein